MNKKQIKEHDEMLKMLRAREAFRHFLVHATYCDAQEGWPCGTCTIHLLEELGVHNDLHHNEPVDRVNEVWRAIMQIREKNSEHG